MKSLSTAAIVDFVLRHPICVRFREVGLRISLPIPLSLQPVLKLHFFVYMAWNRPSVTPTGYRYECLLYPPTGLFGATGDPSEDLAEHRRPWEYFGYSRDEMVYVGEGKRGEEPNAFHLGKAAPSDPYPMAEPTGLAETSYERNVRRREHLFRLTDEILAFHLRPHGSLSDDQRRTLDDYRALFQWYTPKQLLKAYRALNPAHFDWAIAEPGGAVSPYR